MPRSRWLTSLVPLAALLMACLPSPPAFAGTEISVWGTYEDPWFASNEFACLDAPRHRVIAMGEESTTNHCFRVWSLDPTDPHRWVRIEPGGPGPGPLVQDAIVAAAHDSVHHRVFVYQDAKGSASRLSVFDLETDSWLSFPTTGSPPNAQGDATAIYDSKRNQLVVFGGATYGLTTVSPLNTVFVLDLSVSPAVWSTLTPNGTPPTPRYQMSSIYDATRNRMVVFGGSYVVGIPNTIFQLDEVWELRLDAPRWKFLSPATTPPAARAQTSAVWDSLADRMLVYGGLLAGSTRARDVWSLSLSDTNGSTWTQASFAGTLPESSSRHVAVFDAESRRMLVHGGFKGINTNDPTVFVGSVRGLDWESTPTWSVLHGQLRSPDASSPVATYDSKRHQMVVTQAAGSLSGVWTMWLGDPPYWSLIGTHAGSVSNASVIVDSIGNRAMVFGGTGNPGSVLQNQVWTVPLDAPGTLVPFPALGTPPLPRTRHAAICDAVGQRMLVFGGQTAFGPPKNTYSNELWELTLGATPTWTQLAPGGPLPPARADASYVLDAARRRLILYGGTDTLGTRSDVWSLSLDSLVWHPWSVSGGTFASSGRLAAYDPNRDRMLVTFNAGGSAGLLGIRALTLDTTPTWFVVPTTGCGPLETGTSAGVYDPFGDILVLYETAERLVWALQTGSATTPVLLSLAEAGAADGVVRLRWRAEGGVAPSATLERREGSGAWQDLAAIRPGPSGELAFDDALVQPGHRYDYRLRILEDGRATWAGEASVTVPAMLADGDYAIAPVANPGGTLRVRLALPAVYDPEARLEVLDLLGRRIASERIGPGRGRVAILEPAAAHGLRPGLYLVRLRVAGVISRSTRMVVVR